MSEINLREAIRRASELEQVIDINTSIIKRKYISLERIEILKKENEIYRKKIDRIKLAVSQALTHTSWKIVYEKMFNKVKFTEMETSLYSAEQLHDRYYNSLKLLEKININLD